MCAVTLEDIRQARRRIDGSVHRTPVLTSRRLDELAGARLFFKCENLQATGSFKARGALNTVRSLDPAARPRGVVTHSSGNHAAAVSWAAALEGLPATVVMPRTANAFKMAAVRRYGGRIVTCEPTHAAREATAERLRQETGASLVHPFNDERVMAGQGTAALELLEEVPDLDAVVAPCGGGGLLAATATVARALRPGLLVLGVEPAGAADTIASLAAGVRQAVAQPASVADGLLALVGDLTFPVIQARVDRVVAVTDGEIRAAMRRLLDILKLVVEPAGSVGYAAVAEGRLSLGGQRVGILLSGGNVDLDAPPWQP